MPSRRVIYALLLRKSGRAKSSFCGLLFPNCLQLEVVLRLQCHSAGWLLITLKCQSVILQSRGSPVTCPKLSCSKDGTKRALAAGNAKERRRREVKDAQRANFISDSVVSTGSGLSKPSSSIYSKVTRKTNICRNPLNVYTYECPVTSRLIVKDGQTGLGAMVPT